MDCAICLSSQSALCWKVLQEVRPQDHETTKAHVKHWSWLGRYCPDMAEQCIAQVRKWSGDGSICKQNQTAMRILGQINEGLKDCGPEPESFIDQFTASSIGVKRGQEDVAEQEGPQQSPQQQQAPQQQASPPSQLQSPQRQQAPTHRQQHEALQLHAP